MRQSLVPVEHVRQAEQNLLYLAAEPPPVDELSGTVVHSLSSENGWDSGAADAPLPRQCQPHVREGRYSSRERWLRCRLRAVDAS